MRTIETPPDKKLLALLVKFIAKKKIAHRRKMLLELMQAKSAELGENLFEKKIEELEKELEMKNKFFGNKRTFSEMNVLNF